LARDAVGAGALPGLRQPVAEAADRVIREASQEREQVRLDVNPGLPRVLDEGEEIGESGPSVGMPDEQPVLGPQLEGSDRVLRAIVIEVRIRRRDAAREQGALSEQIA
jgi:hypothetical protein